MYIIYIYTIDISYIYLCKTIKTLLSICVTEKDNTSDIIFFNGKFS